MFRDFPWSAKVISLKKRPSPIRRTPHPACNVHTAFPSLTRFLQDSNRMLSLSVVPLLGHSVGAVIRPLSSPAVSPNQGQYITVSLPFLTSSVMMNFESWFMFRESPWSAVVTPLMKNDLTESFDTAFCFPDSRIMSAAAFATAEQTALGTARRPRAWSPRILSH